MLLSFRILDTGGLSTKHVRKNQKLYEWSKDSLNLIIFVIRKGYFTYSGRKDFETAIEFFKQQKKSLSVLVITGCEAMSQIKRKSYVDEFQRDLNTKK